jgi:tryptophan-rich sensory protein
MFNHIICQLIYESAISALAKNAHMNQTVSLAESNWKTYGALLIWLGICFGVAALGGYATSQGLTLYYPSLRKPEWTPPGYVIGTIWQILYTLMAIAAWLVWRKVGVFHPAIFWFMLQLTLNLGWSYAFFVMQCPEIAYYELCALWLSIGITIYVFWPISRTASLLLVPYILWVTFAGYLNYTIWDMN